MIRKRDGSLLTDEFNEDVAIGQILSPHGVAGMSKVFPYTDYPERCHDLKQVTLELNGSRSRLTVENASIYGRFWLFKFKGVDSREQAGRLTGGMLFIPRDQRMTLPEGSYFFDQITGLKVYTVDGEQLGEIAEVISTGGHDLYVLKQQTAGGAPDKKILLPAVRSFIKQIDLSTGRMIVELPEGLTDL
jgi:16S rRNA processing protein RimM